MLEKMTFLTVRKLSHYINYCRKQLHIVSDVEIDRSRVSPALTIFGFVNYELNNVKFSAHLLYCILVKFSKNQLSSFKKSL